MYELIKCLSVFVHNSVNKDLLMYPIKKRLKMFFFFD